MAPEERVPASHVSCKRVDARCAAAAAPAKPVLFLEPVRASASHDLVPLTHTNPETSAKTDFDLHGFRADKNHPTLLSYAHIAVQHHCVR